MTLAALDLTADRLTALTAAPGQPPRAVVFDGDEALPLALLLERRSIQVGKAGLAVCRKLPHQTSAHFLHRLGQPAQVRFRRHRLDSAQALKLVLARAAEGLRGVEAAVLTLPGYLSAAQVALAQELARAAGLPGTVLVHRILAAGLASYAEQPWHHVGILVDIDDHALTCAVLRPRDPDLACLGQEAVVTLGLRLWRERILGRVADLCIRVSRRDPRDLPDTDQHLYDQFDAVLNGVGRNQPATVRLQGPQWYQTVTVPPAEAAAACADLARQAAGVILAALNWAEPQLTSAGVYLTAEAGRLPGLAAAVYQRCENRVPVTVLATDAPARAAFDLALRHGRGDLPAGTYGQAVPLPVEASRPADLIAFPQPRRRTAPDRP